MTPKFPKCLHYQTSRLWVWLTQSEWRLAMGWKDDRIPVGARFSASVQTVPRAYSASFTARTRAFPRGWIGGWRGINYPPHLAPKLNKEQRYTSAPCLCLFGLLQGGIYPLPLPHTRVWVWFELVAIYRKSTEEVSTVNSVKVADLF